MYSNSLLLSGSCSPCLLGRRSHARTSRINRTWQIAVAQQTTVAQQQRTSTGKLQPQQNIAKAFAPATIANLGPGFDWMGCAVEVSQMLAAVHPSQSRAYNVQGTANLKLAYLFALQGEGDVVTARVDSQLPAGQVVIEDITGDDGRLPRIAERNCVGIAAIETIKLLGDIDCGVSLTLNKVNIRSSSSPSLSLTRFLVRFYDLARYRHKQ